MMRNFSSSLSKDNALSFKLKKTFALLSMLCCLGNVAKAADSNIDTPNLDFGSGNFTNWQLYTGWYYLSIEGTDTTTTYDWTSHSWTGNDKDTRFSIQNDHKDDEVVSCSEFKHVPTDLSLTARLGNPMYVEGQRDRKSTDGMAGAERMVYTFTVTENTTLLNYRFACVVKDPSDAKNPHNGFQRPSFKVNITSFDPVTQQPVTLPCARFEAIANNASSDLTQNPECGASQSSSPTQYWFKNWTSASIDLRNYVGQQVTIEIINHDCLSGDDYIGGSHDAYGYFWAETRKLELLSKNCGLSDPVITAPDGFDTYVWSRSDDGPITKDASNPQKVSIPHASLMDGVTYTCTMSNSSSDCGAIDLHTDLSPIEVNPHFVAVDTCGGKVTFTNQSECKSDSIISYTWDFGDGTMSYKKDEKIVHTYTSDGDSYTAKLYATSSLGCVDSFVQDIAIPLVPQLLISGASNVCAGTAVKLTANGASKDFNIIWDDGAEGADYNLIADTSRTFTVTVTDKTRGCSYSATKNLVVRQIPQVYIVGDSAACIGDSVVLVAYNALNFNWNTGVAKDSLVVRPQSTTTYSVTGEASNGCTATVSRTVTVNPLPTIDIDGPVEVCEGTTGTLKASGGVLYQWTDLFTGESREVVPTQTTKYTVRGTDANKCSSTASWTVKVKENPDLSFQGDTLVCAGEIVRLTVAGADEYQWFDGSTNNYYSQLLSHDTVWSVTGTTLGCSSTMNIPITIKPSPYVYINGNTQVCYGDTLTLWGGGAASYIWATGQTSDTLKTVPEASAKYQVTGTGANGCTRVATVDVTVLPLPTVSIKGDQNVCQGALSHLHAQGNANVYYWSTGSISDSITPVVTEPTTYTVKGVDMNNCYSIDSFKVGLIAPPVLSFTGETEICQGGYTMLVVKGASSYLWNNGSTAAYYNASPSMDTTYVITGFLNGCSSQISIPITLRQAPVVWAEGVTQICQGDTVHITAKGAKTYVWSNGTSGETLNASPLTSCSYHLTGKDSLGCQGSADVAVTVRLKPTFTVTGDVEVCEGATATISASGEPVLYSWSNGEIGQTINPIILEETEFTVTGTDAHTCKDTRTFTVKPVLPPTLSYLGDTAVCVGGTIDLVGQGATEYVWNDSVVGSEYTFVPKSSCYIKMTGTSHNCSASRTLTINVLTPPNILITGDDAVCPGDNFKITAQGASKFSWSTGDTTASISYAPQVATTYYATGFDVHGCSTTKSFTVGVRDLPNVSIKLLSYRGCPGSKDTAVVQANGATYYEWSSDPDLEEINKNVNSNKLAVLLDDTTTLYLYGRDLYGCANEDKLTLTPLPREQIEFDIQPKWIEQGNPTVSMKGITPAQASWYWNPGDGSAEQEGRTFHYHYDVDNLSDSVQVKVYAIDSIGCKYSGSEYLYVWKNFWAPTGFTPNNDEKNETFHFYGGQYITNFHYYIFNRQGDIVFEGNSFDAEWDGTFNGKDCPWGVYGWVANYSSDVKGTNFSGERKGFVTIVR